MIKTFTNNTTIKNSNTKKIQLDSLFFLYENYGYTCGDTFANSESYHIIGKKDLLFIKLKFNELENNDSLVDLHLVLPFKNKFQANLKVYKQNHLDLMKSGDIVTKNGIGDELLESVYIDSYNNANQNVTLNLKRLIKYVTPSDNSIIFAIKFECLNGDEAQFYNPSYLNYTLKLDILSASIIKKTGLNSIFTYDDNDFGKSGNVKINLCNGEPIYSLNTISTVSKRMPIVFSIFHNPNKINKINHLDLNLTPSFYYEIEKTEDFIDIKDSAGTTFTYIKTKDDEEREEIFDKNNIKEIERFDDFYYCSLNGSYIFTIKNGTSEKIELHYKDGSIIVFNNSKIETITNSLGHYMQFYWNGDRLNKIENMDGDSMIFSYSASGKIQLVSIPKISKYCYFTVNNDYMFIRERNREDPASIEDLGSDVHGTVLKFTNGKLSSIYDRQTTNYMLLNYQDDNITDIGVYDYIKTKIFYKTNFTFSNHKTMVSDMEGNKLYYYFDSFGRIETAIDNSARTISYNYEIVDDSRFEKITSKSKIQNNRKASLDNHSFERNVTIPNNGTSWYKSLGANATIVEGDFNGKCLKFVGNILKSHYVKQDIKLSKMETVRLNGLIKHENLSDEELSKIRVGISGSYVIKDSATGFTTTKTVSVSEYAKLKNNNNEWYEFSATTYLSSLVTQANLSITIELDHIDKTIFIDNVRLEDDDCTVRNNLIENGYMDTGTNNQLICWSYVNKNDLDGVVSNPDDEDINLILDKKAYRFAPENSLNHRKLYQTIDVSGNAGEEFVFSVLGKSPSQYDSEFFVYVETTSKNNTVNTYYFDFKTDEDGWQVLTKSFIMENDYTSITVGVDYYGKKEAFVGAFQLYRDRFGSYYKYDKKGNLSTVTSDDSSIGRISYDDDNRVSEVYSQDGRYYKYEYDDAGRLEKVSDLYRNTLELSYGEYDEITEQRITMSNGEVIKKSIWYDYANNKETFTDEQGSVTETTKDKYGRVTQKNIANKYKDNYSYNNQSQLLTYKRNSKINTMTYDSKTMLSSALAPNGSNYSFGYDSFGNVKKVLLNNQTLQSNTYSSVDSKGYSKNLLLSTQYGSDTDLYSFEYNDKGLVKKVKIGKTVLCENRFDEDGNLIRTKDNLDDNIIHYGYDANGNMVTKIEENGNAIRYSYDNFGNVQKASYKVNGNKYSVDYQYDYETNDYTAEGYFNILSTLFGDDIIIGDGNGRYGTKIVSSAETLVTEDGFGYKLPYFWFHGQHIRYDLSTTNNLRTNSFGKQNLTYEEWEEEFKKKKIFSIWMKPTNYGDQAIFTFENEQGEKIASLNMAEDGRIYYNSTNSGSKYSTVKLNTKAWNFINIKIRDTDNGTYCLLTVNGISGNQFLIEEKACEIKYLVVLEYKKVSSVQLLKAGMYMALLTIGTYSYSSAELSAINMEGKKYLIANNPPTVSSTIYAKPYKDMDLITLNGSFESMLGLKPKSIPKVSPWIHLSKSRLFSFDKERNKLVFGSYDSSYSLLGLKSNLSYNLNLNENGAISLRFKIESEYNTGNDKALFYFTKDNTNKLGVYISSSNYVSLEINNEKRNSGIKITSDEWHSVGVRFTKNSTELVVDGVQTFTTNYGVDLTDSITFIGSNPLSPSNVTNGLLEMFSFTKTALSISELRNVCDNGEPTVFKNNFDDIGRLTSTEITSNSNDFHVKYTYDKARIKKETDSNGDSIEYEYDAVGNIVKKTYVSQTNPATTETQTESYGYDEMGRLSWEINKDDICQSYTYDDNGNMLSWYSEDRDRVVYADKTFIFDSQIKDRLKSVLDREGRDIEFSYDDDSNPYLPVGMIYGEAEFELTWQGKRLIEVNRTNGAEMYQYDYYSNGLRKSKVLDNIKYYYEGTKLIQMVNGVGNNQTVLDFVYDANGLLIGVNTSEGQYYYRRDITGNIIGILDSKGNYVIKYRYDAWGNVLNKEVIVNCIVSKHNPFLYKGYVYDEETKWYYLQSRYYIPAIGRFLSPDSIDYLDEETIGGLNLYAYCNNNPVNYCDPSGTIPLLFGLIFTVLIGTITSVISQGFQYGWQDINLGQVAVDVVFGVIPIVLATTGIGIPLSIVFSSVLGFSQYAIDSAFHNEELTWAGSLTAIGVGAISGAFSGAGAKNIKNIAKKLDGRASAGVKAIITAITRYGENSTQVNLVRNLYQSAINSATKEIVNKAFTRSLVKTWTIIMPFATGINTLANIFVC